MRDVEMRVPLEWDLKNLIQIFAVVTQPVRW